MPTERLDFSDLHAEGRHYLSEPVARSCTEAAIVCLHRHHASPQRLTVVDGETCASLLEWPAPTPLSLASWANEIDATEAGAYAIAAAVVEATRGLVVVARARTLTGVDWYLGRPDAGRPDNLKEEYGLEVSGAADASDGVLERRLKGKIRQAARGKSNLPAIAVVVGFGALKALVADVSKP